ncbi:probable ATP-dependent RNA helicase DDX5 [Octopus sinensis]|uniref:RNA helicase n=1 Tax=Octopus sinensis TaxID=2607531 RepID=A0A7E6EH94_9MOLL|nr:probable ATP-dependent RNA helicase DDX5 [Octopus sinensis]
MEEAERHFEDSQKIQGIQWGEYRGSFSRSEKHSVKEYHSEEYQIAKEELSHLLLSLLSFMYSMGVFDSQTEELYKQLQSLPTKEETEELESPTYWPSPHVDALSRRLAQLKYSKPTLIQSVAIPVALSGYNMVGIAQTGSGKTLAVLVLVPTRELAQQVQAVSNDLMMGYKVACVYGGAERRRQIREVREGLWTELCVGAQIIVATPGRLIDFLEQDIVDLSKRCSLLIMDEADRMLDLGFEPQIRIILDFKNSRLSILVATDVASRGLDVHDIKFVVNYDFPNCTEDYIHRIGRTGRAQRSGTSYTLLTPKHFRQAGDLIKVLLFVHFRF